MATPGVEKRASRRFNLELPVDVQRPEQHLAHTRDVSSRGICFYTDRKIEAGSEVEFTLTLPPEITLTEAIQVHCKGRIVRVEQSTDGKLTVAAQIDHYQFVASVGQS
ncbi:MAG TPA: PilZ domain-containing protein [Clostridia bacterium]|nr:PilZ domain-containing protein [Clostridia bacterium]